MYYSNKGSVLIFILIVFSIVSTITMMCIGLNYSNSRISNLNYQNIVMKESLLSSIELVHSNILKEVSIALENSETEEEFKGIYDIYENDSSIAARTKGVGILTHEDALIYGACGPHGRASNVNFDVRKTMPYNSYEDFDFKVALAEDGDVFSRAVVRLVEIEESFKIIKQAVINMPDGPINLGNKIPRVPKGESLAVTEAPRGEVSYFVVSNGGQTNSRVNIHVPTFKNAATVPVMLKDNTIADAGLIVASIDPCFSCLDR